jgi:hypothetical protein
MDEDSNQQVANGSNGFWKDLAGKNLELQGIDGRCEKGQNQVTGYYWIGQLKI